jgi:RNA polymerase sigma-70 factor (ECF subfamily)
MEPATLSAWTKLQDDLKSFVYRKVKDKATSEDIVQDVFLKVQANSGQLKDSEKITSWIYTIARNAVVDYYRKNAKAVRPVDVDWESDKQEFNDCVAYCLRIFLNTLPEKYKQALELTDIENLTQLELAERFNISHSAARSRVQRARKMLHDKLHEVYLIKTDSYGNVIVCEGRNPCRPCKC